MGTHTFTDSVGYSKSILWYMCMQWNITKLRKGANQCACSWARLHVLLSAATVESELKYIPLCSSGAHRVHMAWARTELWLSHEVLRKVHSKFLNIYLYLKCTLANVSFITFILICLVGRKEGIMKLSISNWCLCKLQKLFCIYFLVFSVFLLVFGYQSYNFRQERISRPSPCINRN